MLPGTKCSKCGLMQVWRATCKVCGAPLSNSAPHGQATGLAESKAMGTAGILSRFRLGRKPLMLGAVAIVLILAGLYGIRVLTIRAEAKHRIEAERRVANEVLQVLRGLESVTKAGVTYRDYAPRVLDAKVQADRYLQREWADPEIKRVVREAMDLYVLATSSWNARISKKYEGVAEDPALELCPAAKSRRDRLAQEEARGFDQRIVMGFIVAQSQDLLWACASSKIEEIERMLKNQS